MGGEVHLAVMLPYLRIGKVFMKLRQNIFINITITTPQTPIINKDIRDSGKAAIQVYQVSVV